MPWTALQTGLSSSVEIKRDVTFRWTPLHSIRWSDSNELSDSQLSVTAVNPPELCGSVSRAALSALDVALLGFLSLNFRAFFENKTFFPRLPPSEFWWAAALVMLLPPSPTRRTTKITFANGVSKPFNRATAGSRLHFTKVQPGTPSDKSSIWVFLIEAVNG